MGASVLTLSQASGIGFSTQRSNGPLTLDAGTSKVILTGTGAALRPGQHTLYDIEFQNNGQIDPDDMTTGWSCRNLTLPVAKTISFHASKTFTLTGTLVADSTTMKSLTQGTQWTISKASGGVTVLSASLEDSNATGGASFSAIASTDVGNNTGWTFSLTSTSTTTSTSTSSTSTSTSTTSTSSSTSSTTTSTSTTTTMPLRGFIQGVEQQLSNVDISGRPTGEVVPVDEQL